MTGKQLKNSILQWAIQGKLVPQDPNDEPASVLLEKIRAEKARLIKEGKIKKDKKDSIIYRGEDNSYYEKFADGKVICIDDEIPFDIPMGWEWSRLNNICELIEDCPHSTAPDEGEGYPLIRTPNVGYGKLELKDVHRVCKAVYLKRNVRATPVTHDLIFAREAPAGNIAVIEDGEQVCLGQRTVLVRPFKEHLNPYYLAYYILSPISQQILVNSSTGTTVAHVNLSDFRPYLIAIPPYKEQLKIVEMINSVIPVVNQYGNMRYRIDILNDTINIRLKKSILQEAIQGKLIPQDPNDEPASILLQRIKEEKHKLVKEGYLKKKDLVDSVIFKGDDNKYYEQIGREIVDISDEVPFDLPSNWQWVRFGQIVRMCIGKTPARGEVRYWANATKAWVSISDMADYGHIKNTKEKISDVAASSLMGSISPSGSLLMSFKLTVGRTSLLDIDAYHNEAIISIYPYIDDEYALRDYLFYTLPILSNMGDSKDAIKGKTLNSKSLNSLLIPLPPLKEQRHIINRLEELYAHLQSGI